MKTLSERAFGVDKNFVCLGQLIDEFKHYACLLDKRNGRLYIEEIVGKFGNNNLITNYLKQIENEEEWRAALKYVTEKTTIFSPKRIEKITRKKIYFKKKIKL